MPVTSLRLLASITLWALLIGCTTGGGDDTPSAEEPLPDADASAAGSEAVSTVEGGTVVVAVAEEPAVLNPWLADPDSTTGIVARPMLAPLWRIRPDGTLEPWLLADEPDVDGDGDGERFTVTYRIRDDAVWSDGEPIDGDDLLFTLRACRDSLLRDNCAGVDLDASNAEGKQATVVFDAPSAAWRTILSSLPVLPEHELRLRDPQTVWTQEITVSSGPFRFASWTPGERLVLERNDRWWGPPAQLDRIEFRFVDRLTVTALAAGAADVAQMPAAPHILEQVQAHPDLRANVVPGRRWLALDFNAAAPQLESPLVRRALARAVDRATIVTELVQPRSAAAEVLDELPGGPAVAEADTPLFPTHDIAAAGRSLEIAGCVPADDGFRRCDGEPLELGLLATGEEPATDHRGSARNRTPQPALEGHPADQGDAWELDIVAEYVRRQLGEVGVRVTPVQPAADATSEPTQQQGDAGWDLRLTSVAAAADPVLGARRWRCDAAANTQSFCDPSFDALVDRAAETTDAATRSDLEAEAALLLARALPTYPMYEVPELLVRAGTVRGPALNASPWGSTWNVEEWARTERER